MLSCKYSSHHYIFVDVLGVSETNVSAVLTVRQNMLKQHNICMKLVLCMHI